MQRVMTDMGTLGRKRIWCQQMRIRRQRHPSNVAQAMNALRTGLGGDPIQPADESSNSMELILW